MGHKVYVDAGKAWDAVVAAGANSDQRDLFWYLLCTPDSQMWAGVRRFFPAQVLPFAPDKSLEGLQAALSALEAAGVVHYDPQTRLVFMPLILEIQPYNNHNMIFGAVKKGLRDLPDSPVLIPVLEHLAPAEEEAAAEARKKAEAMREGKEKDRALDKVGQMDELARELRNRLARITAATSPSEGGAKGPQSPSVAPAGGLDSPLGGASGGGEVRPENEAAPPEAGQNAPKISPSEGGPKGGYVPGPIPTPIPKPNPTPEEDSPELNPPRRAPPDPNPPEHLGDTLAKIRGQGGSG